MSKALFIPYNILLLFCLLSNRLVAQTKLGMNFSFDYNHLATRQTNELLAPFKTTNSIKNRPFIGGKLGFALTQPLSKTLLLENQFNVGFNGMAYRSSINRDSTSLTMKGNYSFFYAQIPFHLILQFPEKEYSASKFIGIGPSFLFNIVGNSRQKIETFEQEKNRLKFKTDATRLRYGLDAFIGFEGSESSSIRLGFFYDVSGFHTRNMSELKTHQIFIQYCTYFN